ncbi:hypothetical protein SAMN05518871_11080 [Psychrobacillus sp. OK028]|nr:hypothetical protein SAMN05518871_11080 [Psychrobacillus sp. OK028]
MGFNRLFMGYRSNNRGIWRFCGLSLGVYGLSIIYFTNLWYKLSFNLIDYNLLMLIIIDNIIKFCNDIGKVS